MGSVAPALMRPRPPSMPPIRLMLETPTAIANAKEIAAVPGVDVLLIRTNDLCAEMGLVVSTVATA